MTHEIYQQGSLDLLTELAYLPNANELLMPLKGHHKPTYNHSLYTSLLAIEFGGYNNIDDDGLRVLGLAGLLHDIGKKNSDTKMLSISNLSVEDMQHIREHVSHGVEMLRDFKPEEVRWIVALHHSFQKKPYTISGEKDVNYIVGIIPSKLNKERILFLGQVFAIADMCDRIISPDYNNNQSPTSIDGLRERITSGFIGNQEYVNNIIDSIGRIIVEKKITEEVYIQKAIDTRKEIIEMLST